MLASRSYSPQIEQIFSLALQQYKNNNFPETEALLNEILSQNSNCLEALKLRAMLAHRNNHLEQAILDYKRVIDLIPDEVDSYNKLGTIYQQIGQFEASSHYLQKALALMPQSFKTSQLLACCLSKQGKLDKAIALFDRLLAIEPSNIAIRWNRGLALLKKGDFPEGLSGFELRKHFPQFSYFLETPQPLWDGSSVRGKTILLHHGDDGFGDAIQYIRYASLLAERGGRVIFAGKKPLLQLFSGVAGIAQRVELESPLPAFDVYAPLSSLPHYLGTTLETIPAQVPYLHRPTSIKEDGWDLPSLPQPASETRLKIGIVCWESDREILAPANRYIDCPLSLFVSLLSVPDISLYSLQWGKWRVKMDEFKHGSRLYDLSAQIPDVTALAALIAQLDLVIGVDSTAAHLAGAMGKPVWTLLEFDADCRWLLNRSDSPWYPTMRLFRQCQQGDWQSVFAQVMPALKQHLAGDNLSVP
jgi:tetratricopeptide (TPR) repeat protein